MAVLHTHRMHAGHIMTYKCKHMQPPDGRGKVKGSPGTSCTAYASNAATQVVVLGNEH